MRRPDVYGILTRQGSNGVSVIGAFAMNRHLVARATALRIEIASLRYGSPAWHKLNDELCRILSSRR